MTKTQTTPATSTDPEAAAGTAQFLTPVAIGLQALAVNGKQAHWNVRGANFIAIHELLDSIVAHAQAGAHEDRVRLSGEGGAEEPVVQLRDQVAELGASEPRPRSDCTERLHPAPPAEVPQRPHRHLLQAEHVGLVLGGEAHHLLQTARALRRARVAVEDVPGADEQAQSRISLGRC